MAVGRERGCISFSLTQRIDIWPQMTFSSFFFFFGVTVGKKTDQNEKKGLFANTGLKKMEGVCLVQTGAELWVGLGVHKAAWMD